MSPQDNTTILKEYREPQPPEDRPRRYTLLLFDQPATFTIPSRFDPWIGELASRRKNFDFAGFVEETGLQKPVAANTFFTQRFYDKRDIASRSSEAGGGAPDTTPKGRYQLPQAKSFLNGENADHLSLFSSVGIALQSRRWDEFCQGRRGDCSDLDRLGFLCGDHILLF